MALRRNRPALARLLDERFTVDPVSMPDYYEAYFSIPWFRVYTLNVDDLDAAAARRYTLARLPSQLSATAADREGVGGRSAGHVLEVVHLNGIVGQDPERLTFSETQYAERLANAEPWYARCATDLRARPVVFVGTELREETLWQHMELRRRQFPHLTATPPPAGILVTPQLNRARQEMLDAMNIDWFEGTAEAFAAEVLAPMQPDMRRGFAFLEGYDTSGGRLEVPLVSELAAERPALDTEFLLGDEPQWADLISGRAALRTSDAALETAADGILSGATRNAVLAVTGTAGSGKSTALMRVALSLSNRGTPVLWVDKGTSVSISQLRQQLRGMTGPAVLAVDDADLAGAPLGQFIVDVVPNRSQLLVMFAARTGRIDNVVSPVRRSGQIEIVEHVVPLLTDDDIDQLVQVLDRHNRLGVLKGLSPEARRAAFSQRAGRQLLVAMIEATSGQRFEDKVTSELEQLDGVKRYVYGLVSLATSQRHFLTKDEILLAAMSQVGDAVDATAELLRHHLIVAPPPRHEYRSRHRLIADIVVERLQTNRQLKPMLLGLTFAAASKIDPLQERRSRQWRLLIRFTNHAALLQMLGLHDARDIYSELENQLSGDYHFWLQRGSLEVEAGDARLAEHFLNQARSLNSADHRVDTEYGYMLMRKAIDSPADPRADSWIDEGTKLLEGVIVSRGSMDSHAFHVLGSQGLAWSRRRSRTPAERRKLLAYYVNVVGQGLKNHPGQRDLLQLKADLDREVLLTAAF